MMAAGIGIMFMAIITIATVHTQRRRQQDSVDDCIDVNGNVCNNQGNCRYGRCVCPPLFTGPHCLKFKEGMCTRTKDCVRCHVFGTGPLSPQRCYHCQEQSDIESLSIVDQLDNNLMLCLFRDADDDCIFRYGYTETDGGTAHIKVLRTKECPKYK